MHISNIGEENSLIVKVIYFIKLFNFIYLPWLQTKMLDSVCVYVGHDYWLGAEFYVFIRL